MARRVVRLALGALIVLNVIAAIVESVESIGAAYADAFHTFELVSVAVFTVEYALRIWVCVENPSYAGRGGRLRYAASPLAILDVVAILPFYLGALLPIDTRMLRALRLLRLLKLSRHSTAMDTLLTVMRREAASILSSMFIMLIVILFAATGIYAIERHANAAFDSIPKAMWWAAVTLTTVGYGDVVPQSALGQAFGFLITVAGVGMVALPAGILASGFSAELERRREQYRLEVKRAIGDGRVSASDAAALEASREELGLTEEEASSVIETERADHPPDGTCPHCGRSLHDPPADA